MNHLCFTRIKCFHKSIKRFYLKIKDYRTIFEIKKSALAEEEKNAKIKSILDQIRKKEAVLIESFREQEVSFAREYDIQLVSSGI